MVDVNAIRCCSFAKAYKALMDSRKGCLSEKELYSNAIMQYQMPILVTEDCVTSAQYDSMSQKLTLECGCGCGQSPVVSGGNTNKITKFGYRYAIVNDNTCSQFSFGSCDWILDDNGNQYYYAGDWGSSMAAFYPNGGGSVFCILPGSCSNIQSSYILKTTGNVDPVEFNVYDGNCNPYGYATFSYIENTKCFSGTYTIPDSPLTEYLDSLTMAEFGVDMAIGVYSTGNDLYDLVAIQNLLQLFLSSLNDSGATVTVTDIGGGLARIDVANLYTNSTSLTLGSISFPGGTSTITLNEVTCP